MVAVVIDRKLDRNASTGQFELLHKHPAVAIPPYIGTALQVGWCTKAPHYRWARGTKASHYRWACGT